MMTRLQRMHAMRDCTAIRVLPYRLAWVNEVNMLPISDAFHQHIDFIMKKYARRSYDNHKESMPCS